MKKLTLLLPLFISLFLVWCGAQKEVVQEPTQPVVKEQPVKKIAEELKEKDKDLWMTIHMCLMSWGENCDEYLDTANIEKYGKLVQEQCDLMPGMKACDTYFEGQEDHPHDWTEAEGHDDDEWSDHGDLNDSFEWVIFSSNKEFFIDGYDIVVKHKDDIHAWEKITRTISVTQWWNKLDWLEKIDWDDGVWIAKHPDGTVDHLHPLAYTDNTLTFSVATEELWTYQMINSSIAEQ